jgi:hypothetical protein
MSVIVFSILCIRVEDDSKREQQSTENPLCPPASCHFILEFFGITCLEHSCFHIWGKSGI